MEIYHNPRCRKSREAIELLDSKKLEYKVIKYLEDVPTRKDFEKVLVKLNLKPTDILRKGETIFKEKYKGKNFTDEEWITIMLENPKLIERPIIIKGNKAVVARPIQNLENLLGN